MSGGKHWGVYENAQGKREFKRVLAESARILKSDGQAAMIFIEPKSDELVNILKNNSAQANVQSNRS